VRWRIPAVVLVLAALACAPAERKDAALPEAPVEGGRLVRHLATDTETLNFVLHDSQAEKFVLSYIHDPLLDLNQALEVIPGVAESWEVSDDGSSWTFQLDPNATFSDGRPVRAADLIFTLRKIVDPKSESTQYAGMFADLDLERTRALDDHTAEVVFTRARPGQIYSFNIAILPEHVYGKGDFLRAFNDRAIGCGPYKLVRRTPGKEILLERRDDYWRESPWITSILFRIISDRTQAWNALRAGEIDESPITTDQWLMSRDDAALTEAVDFHRFYELGYNFIPWNNRDPILMDANIRRGLTMCLDRRLIIEKLYYGTARVISGPFTPNHWAFNPSVDPIEFDPAAARRVFEESGWSDSDRDGVLDRDGAPLAIDILLATGDTTSANQAQIFQDELARVGVRMTLTQVDFATLVSRLFAGEYQGTMLSWSLDLDPDLFSIFHSSQIPPNGQNFAFYSNPEVDALIMDARATLDHDRRVAIFRQLHSILARDQPYTFTIQASTKWGVNRRIRNVEEAEGLGLYGWYPGSLQWWIAPEDRKFDPTRRGR
jgi:peptide/nickel transport system substrate-binding protein